MRLGIRTGDQSSVSIAAAFDGLTLSPCCRPNVGGRGRRQGGGAASVSVNKTLRGDLGVLGDSETDDAHPSRTGLAIWVGVRLR